ncbi:hypothetical protein OOZ19_05220 [Saccharopolyspora sp. NFXS83]|uniref:hypothetical protein n=1 Tax=Saccharopolyspora sp. NFXS83 TaxID=2993560 RepID=UPI00224B423C|nr:hypothetical protein [Saccharopolyspora sp. NFXS83]MCX2729629.1 hypothetical protein [Saccharopolyspora sp. NFXS83]
MHDGLVDQVRWLVDEQAPQDPDVAASHLHVLIAAHGRADVAAALAVVAPVEIAGLAREGR